MSAAEGPRTPGSMLEVYMAALAGRTNDAFLDEINLGVGYYSDAEYWQQIQAFRNGLFADAAVARTVMELARHEAKRGIVDAIFDRPECDELRGVEFEEPGEGASRREYFEEHADAIWGELGTPDKGKFQHQAELVHEFTGVSRDWIPPFWRMLKARHEASRSKDARLIDNLFGRPPEQEHRSMEEFS